MAKIEYNQPFPFYSRLRLLPSFSPGMGVSFYILQLDNINRKNANLHQMHKTAEH